MREVLRRFFPSFVLADDSERAFKNHFGAQETYCFTAQVYDTFYATYFFTVRVLSAARADWLSSYFDQELFYGNDIYGVSVNYGNFGASLWIICQLRVSA